MCIESTNKVPVIIDKQPNMDKAIQIKTNCTDKMTIMIKIAPGMAGEWLEINIAQLKLAILNAEHSFTV
jgi:hypothetical protein